MSCVLVSTKHYHEGWPSILPFHGKLLLFLSRLTRPEIAHIEDNGQFKRDGGRYLSHEPLLSSRSASQCRNLGVEEAQSPPAIEAYAKSKWGSGSWNIHTNPKEASYSSACITLFKYPEKPAHVCVSDDPVKIELDGDPQYQDSTIDNVSGTSGTDGTQVQQGSNMSSEYTVTTVSKLAISSTLGVSFGVPQMLL
ncbi:uncharacterized protein ARMOST_07417 [Armillaria ostoyae]|uniref:Uncharacterized protein n=1 Tax=Armillaria ostoyae TaxID=47428 RepID=A0A284R5R5_ARMOS|nr:uncharacterized protein ARMOST_07417 [Armillaria ostoyae]